jgi:recombination DNA repair RAD52 pathway protein
MTNFIEPVERALHEPLHPDSVSTRQRMSYLEGHHVKDDLNQVFGIGGWQYEVVDLKYFGPIDVAKDDKTGFSGATVATVKLTIEGSPTPLVISDVGYGNDVSYGPRAEVDIWELAAKEAVTDGIKRCAAKLGDRFGLCLYGEAGRADVEARAEGLPMLDELQLLAKNEVEAELGRKATGAAEVASTLGIRTRDLRSRAALQRVLDARDATT